MKRHNLAGGACCAGEAVGIAVASGAADVGTVRLALNLKPAVERGAEAQLIQPSWLTQKPQLTHRVSLHFCASPSS